MAAFTTLFLPHSVGVGRISPLLCDPHHATGGIESRPASGAGEWFDGTGHHPADVEGCSSLRVALVVAAQNLFRVVADHCRDEPSLTVRSILS